jgi:hypothetical protein
MGTINRTMAELVSDSLVYRYEIGRGAGDGLTGISAARKQTDLKGIQRTKGEQNNGWDSP